MRARRYLTISLSLGAAILITVIAYAAAVRLRTDLGPTAGARIVLDVAGLSPGELRTFRTWDGEFWVVRRTAEQIAVLERAPRSAADIALPDGAPPSFGRLRSADRELFVFRVQRMGDGILLTQLPRQYLLCSDLRLFRGVRGSPGGYQITDGLSCADDPQVAYDLAGMPGSPYLAPLEVPDHVVRRDTVLIRPDS